MSEPTKSVPSSFREVIGLWPSHGDMARDIGAPVTAVPKWSQRDRIPPEWWGLITATAVARAAGVDADLLTGLAARDLAPRFAEARA